MDFSWQRPITCFESSVLVHFVVKKLKAGSPWPDALSIDHIPAHTAHGFYVIGTATIEFMERKISGARAQFVELGNIRRKENRPGGGSGGIR